MLHLNCHTKDKQVIFGFELGHSSLVTNTQFGKKPVFCMLEMEINNLHALASSVWNGQNIGIHRRNELIFFSKNLSEIPQKYLQQMIVGRRVEELGINQM